MNISEKALGGLGRERVWRTNVSDTRNNLLPVHAFEVSHAAVIIGCKTFTWNGYARDVVVDKSEKVTAVATIV